MISIPNNYLHLHLHRLFNANRIRKMYSNKAKLSTVDVYIFI